MWAACPHLVVLDEEGVFLLILLQEHHEIGQHQSIGVQHTAARVLPSYRAGMQEVAPCYQVLALQSRMGYSLLRMNNVHTQTCKSLKIWNAITFLFKKWFRKLQCKVCELPVSCLPWVNMHNKERQCTLLSFISTYKPRNRSKLWEMLSTLWL